MKNISGKLLASGARLSVAALACSFASAAYAGVKYWDNPDFKAYDVGDYVQDGLVLHYDGIRNVGADAEHSTTSDTWVNLASDGGYDLSRFFWSKTGSDSKPWVRNNGSDSGVWNENNGFVFDGKGGFVSTETLTIKPTYTLQLAMTATAAAQNVTENNGSTGYIFRPNPNTPTGSGTWENCSVCLRNTVNGSTTAANAIYTVETARFGNNTTRPQFSNATPRYATVLGTTDALTCFEGTDIPSSGSGYKAGTISTDLTSAWFAIGAQQDGSPRANNGLQAFIGTLHAFRFYDNSLTEEQLAWNRVVDQNRFFGESAPIPVTNIVVATAVEGVDGDQPCGAYALDGDGFTFTAPVHKTINGKRFDLNGYTIETWNDSDWGEAVEHDGNSYNATSSGKVRLTWQYARPAGLKVYDVGDYVQNGLLLHYDGICNVGANAAHDSAAHQWKNIAPGYESRWPMDWCSYLENSADNYSYAHNNYTQGEWTDDGFAFNGKSYFAKWNDGDPFTITANFTVQISVTGAIADQLGDPAYLWTGQYGWDYGSIAMRKSDSSAAVGNANSVYYVNKAVHPSVRPNFYPADAKPSYITAIVDYDDTKASYIFDGITRPAKGGNAAPAITGNSPVTNKTWFSVGGFHNRTGTAANLQSFNGTVHNFRFYNRALTDAEVAQNRKVDEYRFYGRYAEPNVIVQSTYSYLEGYDKCGGYEVNGSYSFVAPETAKAKKIEYACIGYTIETQDANGNWGAAVDYDTRSYTYTAGSGIVRLTWKWKATQGLRSAGDYDADDYAAGGLKVHLDGLRNQGIDAERSTSATKWVNLGSNGATSDATFKKEGSSTDSAWTNDGYYFDGNAEFTIANIGVKTNSTYTLQMLADIDRDKQQLDKDGNNQHDYFFSGIYDKFAISVYGKGNPHLRAGADVKFSLAEGEHVTYFTGIMDQTGASPVAYAFPGTTITSGATSTDAKLTTPTSNNPTLGGWGGNYNQNGIGTIKNFRYYDRVLTEEELIRNRNVDSARYFGELAVTNVVEIIGDTETAYKVEGESTFTAPPTVDSKKVTGYRLEVLENGDWVRKPFCPETTFTYSQEAHPEIYGKTIKLEWAPQPPGMMIIVR